MNTTCPMKKAGAVQEALHSKNLTVEEGLAWLDCVEAYLRCDEHACTWWTGAECGAAPFRQ